MISFLSTSGQLFIGTLAAYAFARIRFIGRNIVFLIFLGTMMIPSYVLITPMYLLINRLGFLNTYAALIVPKLISVFAIFMLRQFFLSMPKELDESAYIDGANRFRVLFQIISPNCKPAYAALFIFSFMGVWNDFMWPLIVTNSETMRTIQVGVAYFKDNNATRYGPTMAASFLASIPILIVFLIANRSFVEGLTMTGIKG
jgi:multiple sugar transport system permease protein